MLEGKRQQIQYLLVIEDKQGKRTVALEAATCSIGRDSTNSIVLNSKLVSRQHAILLRVPTPATNNYVFRLIDGNLQGKRSTNGIIVNDQRCFSRDLKHRDEIRFGKEVKARFYALERLADIEFLTSGETEDISGFLSNLNDPFSTIIAPEIELESSSESALIRLASFPELLSNPIIEMTMSGKITYLNPAAIGRFPGILEIKLQHPILAGLISTVRQGKEKFFIREVECDQQVFEQSIHYIAESDLIRSSIVDITERKRVEAALRESQRRLGSLIDSLPGIVFSCANDPEWSITYLSEGCLNLTGYKSEELVRHGVMPYNSIIQAEDLPKLFQAIEKAVAQKQTYVVEYRIRTKSGQEKWFWEKGSGVFDDNGAVLSLEGFITDITEIKHAEAALRESEERYALAAHGANDGLWDWNLKTNEVYFSSRWKSMLGYCESEIGNSIGEWSKRIHSEDVKQVKAALIAHLKGRTPHFENEHRIWHQDGTYRWVLSRGLAVRDAEGKAYRMAGSQTDITERKRAESQLLHDALHDGLTRLPNRALFIDRLERALQHAKRQKNYLFAVLFLDLDRFKAVNDNLGHLIGDQLLVAIARRLEGCLRTEDTVARLGGDEFTILLENIRNVEDAKRIADKIQQELMLPFNLSGHEVSTSASIGIALSTLGYDRPEDFLRDADQTMYHAKAKFRSS